jgi:hypothetical protein
VIHSVHLMKLSWIYFKGVIMNIDINVTQQLIATAKGRVMELRVELKNAKRPSDRYSIQQAIANNCAWLLTLGENLHVPELEEV